MLNQKDSKILQKLKIHLVNLVILCQAPKVKGKGAEVGEGGRRRARVIRV